MKTAECEGIETAGALLAGAVPARVESVEPIEGGKHIVKAVVDAGRYGRKTVVCGAPNCRAGITTVYVPLGVKTIAGVLSDGMLASAAELEINSDHAGIIELARSARNFRRPTASSRSITRASRIAPICGVITAWRAKWRPSPARRCAIRVNIGCSRRPAVLFRSRSKTCAVPALFARWFSRTSPCSRRRSGCSHRLTAVGLNPINNIVDLTNFIMAELAQPMHAFDRAKLDGRHHLVRPARDGERSSRSTTKSTSSRRRTW